MSQKTILGSQKCSIDKKGRFYIPKFTHIKKGNDLVLVQNQFSFEIHFLLNLENRLNVLESLVNESSTTEEIILLKRKLDLLYMSCISNLKVDSERRVQLPIDFREEYGFLDYLYVLGTGDYIKIFNSDNQINDYKRGLLK